MIRVKHQLMLALFALSAMLGCGLLGSKNPRTEHLECQARALEPVVKDVYDARALLLDLYAGKASLQSVLANLNATPAELAELQAALAACEPPVTLPEGNAS